MSHLFERLWFLHIGAVSDRNPPTPVRREKAGRVGAAELICEQIERIEREREADRT